MVKSKSVLATLATAGLLIANPAIAQSTRSSAALPSASDAQITRATVPMTNANALNPQATLLLALFAGIGAVGLLVAASSGNGNQSPG